MVRIIDVCDQDVEPLKLRNFNGFLSGSGNLDFETQLTEPCPEIISSRTLSVQKKNIAGHLIFRLAPLPKGRFASWLNKLTKVSALPILNS